jgi:hypothetical protein
MVRAMTETRSRRLLVAFAIWLVCLATFALLAGDRLFSHTKYNHFAFLADAWLHGRHDLGGRPPDYSGGNDWALFQGKWYVSFPPFPAMLMLPFVALARGPDNFYDGQFVVWLAGIGPAVLFLVLEKLRRDRQSGRSEKDNVFLSLLFAFGTVYFFTAVQGTVWYAAHVVGVALMALFVLVSIDAKRPVLAGALLGCMFLTRVTTVLVAIFFVFEAAYASCMYPHHSAPSEPRHMAEQGPFSARLRTVWRDLDKGVFARKIALFSIPVMVALAFASFYNFARFGDANPTAFGHEYLQVGWLHRIQTWGLFGYHYLGRNLATMLTGLPWRPPLAMTNAAFGGVPFKINGHGLALWYTSPFYLWHLWPARRLDWLGLGALFAALGPLIVNLFYQNSGWVQFGYRFSNDYAILLFVLLAMGGRRFGKAFWLCAAWAVAWNLFGAATFERKSVYYAYDADHVYQPD